MLTKSCADCGAQVTRRRFESELAFCNVTCRNRYLVARRVAGRERKGRKCEVCGEHYNATYTEQRACGRECGSKLQAKYLWPSSKVWFGQCSECDTWIARRRKVNTCSLRCSNIRYNRLNRPSPDHHICPCGVVLSNKRSRCDECLRLSRKARRRRDKDRRRALKKGALVVETVTTAYIAKRDGWRCHLCGKAVHRHKVAPHPLSPSLDHVVPLSRGGEHSKANVRLAHLRCNVLKRDAAMGEQLMLIG